jgi:hypothetical protein
VNIQFYVTKFYGTVSFINFNLEIRCMRDRKTGTGYKDMQQDAKIQYYKSLINKSLKFSDAQQNVLDMYSD